MKKWLRENKHVKTVTRDHASVYAKAVEEILPDCMQIANRFHLHQNLMKAVNKILGREIPATTAIIPNEKLQEAQDISAIENAVASNLSNGFVEGTNNKVKMVKRTMYGRCSKKLLATKLMYTTV